MPLQALPPPSTGTDSGAKLLNPSPGNLATGEVQRIHLFSEIKDIFRDFLSRLKYQAPHSSINTQLRIEVAAEIESWKAGLTPTFIDGVTDTGCGMVESAYAHLPYKHQFLVAIYAVYLLYVDDLGQHKVDALGQVGRWLAAREEVSDPILKRMVAKFDEMYEYFPALSADLINANIVEGIIGRHIECVTSNTGMVVGSGATLYATSLRLKTGIGAAFALFNFPKGWRHPDDYYYLQVSPAIEHNICAINDILSFYKETLEGETDNYVHTRAAAESKEPLTVVRELVEETLDNIHNIELLTAADEQLAMICRGHLMGYVEFNLRAKRYRLQELDLEI
ncbi:terpenoid synthase [Trametes coccinea BRFM310]|uniref:Terpenoid synthase n=1 Tax=Trametes coccinea (strain BRFM310) TaxID=1353009 RepID=A0A1Y2J5C9_TRAC3|nr:terpenoid synthase [Trametes coccinea BRFM310]